MAWYDANRNRGHNYGRIEPEYGGIKPAIYGYSATKESYAATTDQVVEYRNFPAPIVTADNKYNPRKIDFHDDRGRFPAATVTADNKYSPKKIDFQQDHGLGHNPLLGPRSSIHDSPKKGDKFSPRFGHKTGSPRNNVYKVHNNNLSSDDEDEDDDDDDDKEKRKGNGYGRSYTLPVTTRKDPYYEPPNKNKNIMNNPPPPIKTRADRGPVEHTTKNSPVSAVAQHSPRKDHVYPATIDSAEARRRYGKASPKADGQKPTGIIDSREAARRYSGVFVSE